MNKFSFRLTSTINEICIERPVVDDDQVYSLIGIVLLSLLSVMVESHSLVRHEKKRGGKQILIESDNFSLIKTRTKTTNIIIPFSSLVSERIFSFSLSKIVSFPTILLLLTSMTFDMSVNH